jgi:tetratricopeptide (TPR) repeat protein
MERIIPWIFSRVGMIYIIVLVFCLSFVNFKSLDERIKVRFLNDAIPDFSDLIIFTKDPNAKNELDWRPYKNYFGLIYRYMPRDPVARQLQGLVDYYTGREQEAVNLFESTAMEKGKFLFWSNYNLGVIYYKKGLWSKAAESLFKAIGSSPKLTVLLMDHSLVYRQIMMNPYFKYSLTDELKDGLSHAYILLLSSLSYMKQYDKMIYIANAAIGNPILSHKDAFYYFEGLAFFEMGHFQEAFGLFEKSLTMEKENPYTYYYLANIYQKAGQAEQAHTLLQASYTLHQRNDPRFPYETQAKLRFF